MQRDTRPYQLILGGKDPEMIAIREIALGNHLNVFQGTVKGQRCTRSNAYRIDGFAQVDGSRACPQADMPILLVECNGPIVETLEELGYEVVKADHHYPGDPGFENPPEKYWSGSSIGQVCTLLGVEPTPRLRLVAASDHCPVDAYRGRCPGVEPADLMQYRVEICATKAGVTNHEIEARVARAMGIIQARVSSGEIVPHFDRVYPMLPEASMRLGVPITFQIDKSLKDDRRKAGIMNADPGLVDDWMQNTAKSLGLVDIYGSPIRGYAGGYFC